jgi:hypothetical protein
MKDDVFLELNSSPISLDVEVKLGHPIRRAIAKAVVEAARTAGECGRLGARQSFATGNRWA